MTTINPFNWFGVFRASMMVLLSLTLAWGALSFILFQDIVISQGLVAVLLSVAVILGPFVYQRYYRLALQYDDKGFALFTGQTKVAGGQWSHFNQVTLFHQGYGQFAVRLYTPDKTHIDIPVSELKLEVDAFRRYAMRLVKQPAGDE
jgi:hypothetical protein